MIKAIINSIIFTGEQVLHDKILITRNGVIDQVSGELPAGVETIDLKGKNIAAGFIDIQLNGGEQFYFSERPTHETLEDMMQASLSSGTTSFLACLISTTHENILQSIEAIRSFMAIHPGLIGMHLEGPFLNPVKRGAHVKEMVRTPTDAELEAIIAAGKGVIKVMTIAPECFTDQQLTMLANSGIVLSAGHSDMNYNQAQVAFSKGISLVTHLYNAMTQLEHRAPGIVGAVFDNDKVYAPIILDGAHCDYAAARIAKKIKDDHLFLISDAAFLNRKVKSFSWNGFSAKLVDGFYRNEAGQLAGAAISMAEAVRNAVTHLNISLEEAIKMATIYAAKAIRMDDRIGQIAPGYPARFVVFDDQLESIETLLL